MFSCSAAYHRVGVVSVYVVVNVEVVQTAPEGHAPFAMMAPAAAETGRSVLMVAGREMVMAAVAGHTGATGVTGRGVMGTTGREVEQTVEAELANTYPSAQTQAPEMARELAGH